MPEPSKTEAFKTEIQEKIKKLIQEFSEGKISSEQFDLIYTRYNNQLALAEQSLYGEEYESPVETIAILDATKGRALGMSIYHHRSGTTLETLGNYDLAADVTSPVLNEFSLKLEARELVDPLIKKVSRDTWVAFLAREFTTIIVVFRNEPSRLQMRQLQRLHHDFEEANRRFLDKYTVDKSSLARPFSGFIKEKAG